ncbi:MAG TPA: hypothetical protein VG603_13930 [Chitinophagales bacterium]|nr:hypothetical protein [Chitinophagales bacterium]
MIRYFAKGKGKMFKAIALVGVYCLHFIFFQAVMTSPDQDFSTSLKPLLVYGQKTNNLPNPTSSHAANSYYQLLLKQGNPDLKSVNNIPSVTAVATKLVLPLLTIESTIKGYLEFMPVHVPDSAFRLYSLLKVFLI